MTYNVFGGTLSLTQSINHCWLPTDIQVKHLITLVAHQSLVNLVNDVLKLAKETYSYLFADFRVTVAALMLSK